ncbi:MAG: methionyl-tRNA formyltransferase [Verrucomicrobiota bacterium]
MKIVFLGTGDIGIPSLERLIASPDHEILAVFTQPDKPVGRHQALTPPAVKVLAEASAIPVHQPEKLRGEETLNLLESFDADVFVVVAYGQILRTRALRAPRLACLNVHASLLPRHRGASPIQAAIREGDSNSGVTIMFMDEGLDTGDILLTQEIALARNETGGSLHDKLAGIAPAALLEALELLADGTTPREPQNDSESTHCAKLTREHGRIDWSNSAVEIERTVRAYDPWPGTSTSLPSGEGKPRKLKVFPPCEVIEGEAGPEPGTILSADGSGIVVSTGEALLCLQSIQLEGKKRMDVASFLAGNEVQPGMKFTPA